MGQSMLFKGFEGGHSHTTLTCSLIVSSCITRPKSYGRWKLIHSLHFFYLGSFFSI
ncbi:hypothetical protein XELAEV_18026067mg [Xenopus laevis]|uniref:Uncharacterized protein n=1 Tax=Xenopus laevis TaxID=8355 RepID=A0A974CUZ2_XENLA|nr:hypothetical protein XELAEV_18026067mg [Xenopus laevis]